MKAARPFVVAIDGPAASGKGTLARRLAERFGLAHLDTGKLYRATASLVLAAGADPADAEVAATAARQVDMTHLADPALLGEEVAQASSIVAAIPAVRAALLDRQREFAAHPPAPFRGAVLDGRDIGTAVCPDATVKLFLTASPEARAERRVQEVRERGGKMLVDVTVAVPAPASVSIETVRRELPHGEVTIKAVEGGLRGQSVSRLRVPE